MTRKRVSDKKTLSWHPHHTRLNFEFEIVDGKMTEYMIQLEYNDGSYERPDWKQAARSDTAHGYHHIDFHFKSGRKIQRRESLPQNLRPDEEYESAKDLFVENEYEILRRLGYV